MSSIDHARCLNFKMLWGWGVAVQDKMSKSCLSCFFFYLQCICNIHIHIQPIYECFNFFSSISLVVLDYKGLLLLWEKVGDDHFILGGQGLVAEFCIFRLAMRVGL